MIWSRPDLRVLFVCSANLCRSPLAEGMLRHRLKNLELDNRIQVRSAGSCTGQSGRRPDPRIEKVAAEAGVSLARIRARRLTRNLILRSDYVLVMERCHLDDVADIFATEEQDSVTDERHIPAHVMLLGCFLPPHPQRTQDIPDPYFGDINTLLAVYDLIDTALDGLLPHLEVRLESFRSSQQ